MAWLAAIPVAAWAADKLYNAFKPDDPAPAGPGPAPQIDPNTGIGTGYGGLGALTPEQLATYQQIQANQQQAAQLDSAWNAAKQAYAANPTPENYKAIQSTYFARMQYNQARHDPAAPDGSDPTRFSNLATMAHNEQGPAAPHAAHVGLDPNAGVADYHNFQADRGQFMQDRAQLGGVADNVRLRALGQGGPSAAEQQLGLGNQMAMNNALSIARSQRGGGGGLATIEALRANAGQTQDYNRQAATLRSQEQMGAQTMYGNIMNAQQGMDLSQQGQDLAARQQGFGQAMQGAQFDWNQNQFNTGLDAQRQQQQQQLNAMREQQYLNAYMQTHSMQQQNAQFNAQLQSGNQGLAATTSLQQQQLDMQRQQYQQQQMNAYLNAAGTGIAQYATSKPAPAAAPAQPSSQPYDPYDPGY